MMFNTLIGGFAAWKCNPFRINAMSTYTIFRKRWMQLPMQTAAFIMTMFMANQFQTRLFRKFEWSSYVNYKGGVKDTTYMNNYDLVSKFRFFEEGVAHADAESQVQSYLDLYTSGPLTKAEMLNRIADGRCEDEYMSKFKFVKNGKDTDPVFWELGKIHGLEYLGLATEAELKETKGHPILVQKLANKIMDEKRVPIPTNFDD